MKFNKFKTRKNKLTDKIKLELAKTNPDISLIVKAVDDYESDNLMTIEKLRKDRLLEAKRISGALKQTIHSHGPITKLLIGSATKRIMGSLISDTKKDKSEIKTNVLVVIVSLLVSALVLTWFFY